MLTNNIPPFWQEIVVKAIEDQYALQRETQKTYLEVLQEVYKRLREEFKASGADPEEVPAWLMNYCARAIYRVMAYGVWYASENPPSHRKGFGDAQITKILLVKDLLFKFDGSIDDDWAPGPGDKFPDPEPAPDEDPDGPWWESMVPDRIDIVRQTKAEHEDEWNAMNRSNDQTFIRRLAWNLHMVDEKFGLNGKRGSYTISNDAVAYLNPTVDNADFGPGVEIIDVVISHGAPNASPGWLNVTVPVSWGGSGGRWIQPDPVD